MVAAVVPVKGWDCSGEARAGGKPFTCLQYLWGGSVHGAFERPRSMSTSREGVHAKADKLLSSTPGFLVLVGGGNVPARAPTNPCCPIYTTCHWNSSPLLDRLQFRRCQPVIRQAMVTERWLWYDPLLRI